MNPYVRSSCTAAKIIRYQYSVIGITKRTGEYQSIEECKLTLLLLEKLPQTKMSAKMKLGITIVGQLVDFICHIQSAPNSKNTNL